MDVATISGAKVTAFRRIAFFLCNGSADGIPCGFTAVWVDVLADIRTAFTVIATWSELAHIAAA